MRGQHQQSHSHGHSFTPRVDNNTRKVWLESQKSRLATPTATTQPRSYWSGSPSVFSTDDSAAGAGAGAGASASERTHTNTHSNITYVQECGPQSKKISAQLHALKIHRLQPHTRQRTNQHTHTQPSCCVQRTGGAEDERKRGQGSFFHFNFSILSSLSFSALPRFLTGIPVSSQLSRSFTPSFFQSVWTLQRPLILIQNETEKHE